MNCPMCQSKNTKKLSMVYATGTRVYDSQSSGTGLSSRGTISSRRQRRKTSSQNALAAAATPPKPSPIPKIVTAVLLISFVLPTFALVFAPTDISIWKRIMAFIVFSIFSVITYFIYKFLNKLYEKKRADWNRAWICMRCGHLYDPLD